MTGRKRYSPDERRVIESRFLAGELAKHLAREFGTTAHRLRQRLWAWGAVRADPARTERLVRAGHAAGLSDAAIGRRHGINRQYVSAVRHRLGLPPSGRAGGTPESYRKGVRRAGVAPSQVLRERLRLRAFLAGWPAGCTPAQAGVLAAFEVSGPARAAAALGAARARTALWSLVAVRKAGWLVPAGGRRWRLADVVAAGRARWRASTSEREAG